MKPSEKSPAIENLLDKLSGRSGAIKENVCLDPPIGCGQPISNFNMWSEIEQAEYRISGLCQSCQREVFKANYDEA